MTTPASTTVAPFRGTGAKPPSLLDSYTHYRNSDPPRPKKPYCGTWTMVGDGSHSVKHLRHRCKGYRCGRCGPRKRRQLSRRLGQLATEHKLFRMLTLTLDPAKMPPGTDSIKYIRGVVWRKMRVYLARRLRRTVAYEAILELQGNGRAHLHVLIDAFIPWEWVRAAWGALGGGHVRIEKIDVRNVSAYLSKYLTKDPERELPSGVRHVTTSRGLVIWPEAHKSDPGSVETRWTLSRLPIDLHYERAHARKDEHYETEPDGCRTLVWFVSEMTSEGGSGPSELPRTREEIAYE